MPKKISVGIIDFNPKRMNADQAKQYGIPEIYRSQLADFRQYPWATGALLPDNVSWFDPERVWFFEKLLTTPQRMDQLSQDDVLILSGSGLSAFAYQKGGLKEKRELLRQSEEVVKDFLSKGKWVLGICFGGQLAIHAVGGTIGRLPKNSRGIDTTEAGWLAHQLTPSGKADEVFEFLPDNFFAPHFHNDYVANLPKTESIVNTNTGLLKIVKSEILATRCGYLDDKGLQNTNMQYIQASVVIFNNGARLYQIQPHPEMATPDKINFLVRMNPWLKDEMGEEYYRQALAVPSCVDYSIVEIFKKFSELSPKKIKNRKTGPANDLELSKRKKYLLV